ncbi:hypothetical protein SDC9_188456 [bioreactor metagenome]|uniref:Uncharacterized protein n=1 Tax=bioreactor metagenome TaxID=1076179 RepID=A0A645HQS9_9ZZZZ
MSLAFGYQAYSLPAGFRFILFIYYFELCKLNSAISCCLQDLFLISYQYRFSNAQILGRLHRSEHLRILRYCNGKGFGPLLLSGFYDFIKGFYHKFYFTSSS